MPLDRQPRLFYTRAKVKTTPSDANWLFNTGENGFNYAQLSSVVDTHDDGDIGFVAVYFCASVRFTFNRTDCCPCELCSSFLFTFLVTLSFLRDPARGKRFFFRSNRFCININPSQRISQLSGIFVLPASSVNYFRTWDTHIKLRDKIVDA